MPAWVITTSYVEDAADWMKATTVAVEGPASVGQDEVDSLKNGEGFAFRIFDGDGILYFEGRCLERAFSPLDDYGTPNAGAARIDYQVRGSEEWETL